MDFGIKNSANNAAIKAFIVNRIGDFGFAIGIFLIFIFFDTLNYEEVFTLAPNLADTEINFLGLEVNLITVTCLFLFIGAMGKSAQFFYTHGYQMQWKDLHQYQL